MNTTQVTSTPALLSNGLAAPSVRYAVRAPGLLASRWFWAGGVASVGMWVAAFLTLLRYL